MVFTEGDRVTVIDDKTAWQWQGMEGTVITIPNFPGIYGIRLDTKEGLIIFREHEIAPIDAPEPTYPPVSGGSLAMDADETACGAVCQDLNDRMWAKLGPVDDVELPF